MSFRLERLILILLLCLPMITIGQNSSKAITDLDHTVQTQLKNQFKSFSVHQIDAAQVRAAISQQTENEGIRINLGQESWNLNLYPNDLRANSHSRWTHNANGELVELNKMPVITYSGYLNNVQGSDVRMTITDDMILGIVKTPEKEMFIENLKFVVKGKVDNDLYVVYDVKDVIPDPNSSCGFDEVLHAVDKAKKEIEDKPEMACYELVVGLAHDKDMVTAKGGSGAAEAHTIGILNLVQTNYDDEFADEIKFTVGPLYSVTGNNPGSWNYGSIGALLSSFGSWANGGGMGTTAFDLATLWTGRNLSGNVIGVAWLNSVCGGRRYNVCENFSNNSNALRNLQAHEMGHNFGCGHDAQGSPYIMAPAVNGSVIWSGASIATVNNNVPFGCMGPCPAGAPPVADFFATPFQGCVPMNVQFTDVSTQNPFSWFWEFPGGVPTSSTQQHPNVNYFTPGRYDVTLEATNAAGTSTERKILYIEAGDVPIAQFDPIINQDEVNFIDRSIVVGIGNYRWDFGDGQFSTEQNPLHIYDQDGVYLVTLTVSTMCGTNVYQEIIEIITPPTAEFEGSPLEGCVGSAVTFENQSSDNVTSYFWEFESGNPQTSNQKDPIVVYDTSGVFQVKLVVRNKRYTDIETKLSYITIDSAGVADFNPDVDSLMVDFENTSDYGREYTWDFGDGKTSKEKDPSHTYEKDSMYEVMLITENFCNSDTIRKTISVGAIPTAELEADEPEGCLVHTVNFTDKSSPNTTKRSWIFEGGMPSTSDEENPSVVYENTGKFKVTLIAKNGLGNDTLVLDTFVVIQDDPIADFSYTRTGYDVDFENESEEGTSYHWDFGDNMTSMEEDPMHTYGGDGDYTVVLITTNLCGSDTTEEVISISNRPNANFVADVTSGCIPLTVKLENRSSDNSVDYKWSIPGGEPSTSTEENPEIKFNAPGLYRISLVAINQFGEDTIVRRDYIEVLDVPEASFAVNQSGFTVEFEEQSKWGKEFEWDFGDMETSTSANPVHVYADEGVYTVVMKAKNDCGVDEFEMELTITPKPNIQISADIQEICAGDQIQFTDESGGEPTSWSWTFEGGDPATSTDQNPLVTYENGGTYSVTLEATNQYGTNVLVFDQYVDVYESPVSAWDYTPKGIRANFFNSSEWYQVLEWDFGDGSTSEEFEPSHLYEESGTYKVRLVVQNPCGLDTLEKDVKVRFQDLDVVVMGPPPAPNPSNGRIMINYTGIPSEKVEVLIASNTGGIEKIMEAPFTTGQLEANLDLSHLADGSYMIFIKTANDVVMHKVVLAK